MASITSAQHRTANWLLKQSINQPEDAIRQRIGRMLDSLDIDYELSYRSPYATGPCDLYLPRRRTIIETKVVGLANEPEKSYPSREDESPRQQLERYLRAEIEYEINSLDLDGQANRPWVGIVTDGSVWHMWRYPHELNAVGLSVGGAFRPPNARALIDHVQSILQGDPVGKPWIPSNPRQIFEPLHVSLSEIYDDMPLRVQNATATKRALWLEMLRTSSMAPENELAEHKLFVAHSFLVSLARGVIHVLAHPKEMPVAEEILGNGFVAWIVDSAKGKQWANELFATIYTYEWRRRPGDVLRPLYEHFVDARDRKVYGEFYTPDWLAELLVREVCDDDWCDRAVEGALVSLRSQSRLQGVGVIDPTCGSGTFLYHSALKLLASPNMASLSNPDKAAVVCSLVNGIDVHPVAAEISRATLLRALPAEPPQGETALRIHEGDALMVHGDDESSLFRPLNGEIRIETPQGRVVLLPRVLVERPTFIDDLRRLVMSAQKRMGVPNDIRRIGTADDELAIVECHREFVDIIQSEGNSVWTWYIRNITGPYRLAETKVDRIVANPPWVKMSEIQAADRKRSLEQFAADKKLGLWTGGKQAPHFDIAQLFIKRCRELYLNNPSTDPGAWLVKKSALGAGNWEVFRKWHESVLCQTLNLEHVQPFGGGDARRCCVLFESRKSSLTPRGRKHLRATVQNGKKPKPSDRLTDVLQRIKVQGIPRTIPKQKSDFVDHADRSLFRQGATITPKVLTVTNTQGVGEAVGQSSITTVRSDKKPWCDLDPQTGELPSNWLRNLVVSKAILPFGVSPLLDLRSIIPIAPNGSLDKRAGETNSFWRMLERNYEDYRGKGKSTPRSLLARMDFGSGLTAQLGLSGNLRNVVVYPSSGDIMRACRLRAGEAIIDATLYWFAAPSASEAAYLVAILNAPCLNQAFVESRTSGRHFHLHPWRAIPIRRYDAQDPDHGALIRLADKAEKLVKKMLASAEVTDQGLGQRGLSTRIRETLAGSGILDEIDSGVQRILPRQSRVLS